MKAVKPIIIKTCTCYNVKKHVLVPKNLCPCHISLQEKLATVQKSSFMTTTIKTEFKMDKI